MRLVIEMALVTCVCVNTTWRSRFLEKALEGIHSELSAYEFLLRTGIYIFLVTGQATAFDEFVGLHDSPKVTVSRFLTTAARPARRIVSALAMHLATDGMHACVLVNYRLAVGIYDLQSAFVSTGSLHQFVKLLVNAVSVQMYQLGMCSTELCSSPTRADVYIYKSACVRPLWRLQCHSYWVVVVLLQQ